MHGVGVASAGASAGHNAAAACCRRRAPAAQPSKARALLACRAAAGDDEGGAASSSSSVPDTLPLVAPDADWRAFRAQLVASAAGAPAASAPSGAAAEMWAHELTAPEPGCLLLASPLMFGSSQTYFHRAVILVTAHGPAGTAGLIINSPMDHVIGDLATCNLQPHFDRCRLYLGGDVDPRAVQVLHALPAADAPDAQELLPGVRLGGFESVRRALAEGRASPDEVKILTRYAGWGPGQLEAEVARGVWHVAAAAPGAVLAPAAPGRGADMWHAVLRLMGGDYAALSEAARGGLDEEVMGRGAGAGGEGAAGGGRDPEDSWKGSGI